MKTYNLFETGEINSTRESRSYRLNKTSVKLELYQIPVGLLYYNDKNGRIASELAKYEATNGQIVSIDNDVDVYNNIIESMIEESNPEALKKTKSSIYEVGQLEPAVVLKDGRVIDGNRRFTCLRQIQRDTNTPQFLLAAIIDKDYENDEKVIKALELSLQLGKEQPLDYDPINRLVDLRRDLVEKKLFTSDEYAAITGIKKSEVESQLEQATLMCEFLEFIGNPNAYHIAKELKLNGTLVEIPAILKKCDREHKEPMKNKIFADLLMGIDSDFSKYVRKYKAIASDKDTLTAFLKDSSEDVDKVIDLTEQYKIADSKTINDHIRTEEDIKDALLTTSQSFIELAESEKKKELPSKQVKSAIDDLNKIRTLMFPRLSAQEKEELRKNLDKLEEKLNELRDKL